MGSPKISRDVLEALKNCIEHYQAGNYDTARRYLEWALRAMLKEQERTHGPSRTPD